MSDIYPIAVPKWGIEMVEGTIATWSKAVGDVVAKGDEVQSRPVKLGVAIGSRMEVLDGLGEGERVVVRGNERLRPGAKIQVIGES